MQFSQSVWQIKRKPMILRDISTSKKSQVHQPSMIVLLAVFGLLTLFSMNVAAQDLASLTGVVTDSTGAVIPGAAVKLIDTRTNTSYETQTNDVGAYTFSKVLPGPGYIL